MASLSLKCTKCNQELRHLYTEWKKKDKHCDRYGCRNAECDAQDLCGVYLICPELITQDYLLPIEFNGTLYYIFSDKRGTCLYKGQLEETVLMLDRGHPLNLNLNIKDQIKQVFSKLQTLLLFS